MSDYFRDSHLSNQEEKYCRCVLHVAAKNSEECNSSKAWGSDHCYNPYAVCAKSTRASSRECGSSYDWEGIPEQEVRAYAQMKGIPLNGTETHTDLLEKIANWKTRKYTKA